MKNKQIILGFMICIMIVSIIYIGSYYNKSYTNEENIVEPKLAIVLIDENGNASATNEVPDASEYYLDFVKSKCSNGSHIGWDKENNKVKIRSNKADNCKLYFRKGTASLLGDLIMSSNTVSSETPSFSSVTVDGEFGFYSAEDDYGTSYYFRGDVENNYVKFGKWSENDESGNAGKEMYWRIVRINGDGTIRLIYDGTDAVANGTKHNVIIGASGYNNNAVESKYVGYTYENEAGIQTNSTIKGVIDTWYDTNLEINYGSYIADSIFCNDRTSRTADDGYTYYGAYDRLYTNKTPQLTCNQKDDRYAMNTIYGNGYLTNPVGLITADEVAYAGGMVYETNNTFYLANANIWYWTSSPFNYEESNANVWYFHVGNRIDHRYITLASAGGVRPVINIDSDILFAGTGTIDNPYVLAGTVNE